ncbi:hypothetical protein AB5J62_37610 [Amycolatopsis sp. cg5]|uniref:hypothetical protein n=1 Tax=Amycolatopsis sp. cg5 TaxID=3238802 RepID=UPI003525CB3A
MEGSTTQNNVTKGGLRAVMYDLLERSMAESGIAEAFREPLIDRGDGVLALIQPVDEVPKTVFLSHLIPTLSALLTEHMLDYPEMRLRMRAVLHAGEVHRDRQGWFGETLDVAFRLLDAPQVKQALKKSADPLTVVVSDNIYLSIVRHGYDGIDQHDFQPSVQVKVAGQYHRGWLRLPAAVPRQPTAGDFRRRRPLIRLRPPSSAVG